MKLVITAIFLFCLIFALAIPMKMENVKLAALILQEEVLENSVAVVRYDLSLVEKSIDSLSSRNRIDNVAFSLGLGMNGVATKIAGYLK
jgi:cell division protein FtsL